MNEERKSWFNSATIVPVIPTTILAAAAVFWVFKGIATQSDLNLIREDFKQDLSSMREDFNRRFDQIDKRLDKLDRDFEYIRNNMITKSDIQQLQVDVAENKQRFDNHLTTHHGSSSR